MSTSTRSLEAASPRSDGSELAPLVPAAKRLEAALKKLMDSSKNHDAAVGLQINDLQGLSEGDKLWLMNVHEKFVENKNEGKDFRNGSISLDIGYGVCAAVVPILIPFSQTYKATEVEIMNHMIHIGTVISIIAVMCSLAGTILHTYMIASKSKEQAILYDEEASRTDDEMNVFLARAGPYNDCANDADRYKLFVINYGKIRVETSRSQLFSSGGGGKSGGDDDSSKQPGSA